MLKSGRCPRRRSIRGGRIQAVHHFAGPPLGLFWLPCVVVEVDHVLRRLIAMSVVAHVCDLHFGNFVDEDSIVAVVIDWRHHKHRIKHLHESFAAFHQLDQPIDIMEYRSGVVPCIALRINLNVTRCVCCRKLRIICKIRIICKSSSGLLDILDQIQVVVCQRKVISSIGVHISIYIIGVVITYRTIVQRCELIARINISERICPRTVLCAAQHAYIPITVVGQSFFDK